MKAVDEIKRLRKRYDNGEISREKFMQLRERFKWRAASDVLHSRNGNDGRDDIYSARNRRPPSH